MGSQCCPLAHQLMYNRSRYWTSTAMRRRSAPNRDMGKDWTPRVHPNLWRFPCCASPSLPSKPHEGKDLSTLSGRVLVIIFGDSVSMQVITALLCYLERHASDDARLPDVVYDSWPTPSATNRTTVTPIASYASGLLVAHASLPYPALSQAQAASLLSTSNVAAAFGREETMSWDRTHLVLVGGGAPLLAHHWASVPECSRHIPRRWRHQLLAADRPCANAACFAKYSRFANDTLRPLAAAAMASGMASGAAGSVTVSVTSSIPSHFATESGEWHSMPLNTTLPHAGTSGCVTLAGLPQASTTRSLQHATATLACPGPKGHASHGNGPLHVRGPIRADGSSKAAWRGDSGEAAWAWRDLLLRELARMSDAVFVDLHRPLSSLWAWNLGQRPRVSTSGIAIRPGGRATDGQQANFALGANGLSNSTKLDCLHYCMNARVWDPLVAEIFG